MQDLTASRRIGSAADINDKGQVVGWFSDGTGTPGDFQAFITGPNGTGMARIAEDPDEIPAWLFIVPSSINAAGQVAGSAGDPPSRPFITGENGVGIRDVGTSGSGVDGSYASGINDAGQVVGSYVTRELTLSRPYITGPDGVGVRYLGTPGESDGYASSINDSGQVVGRGTTQSTVLHIRSSLALMASASLTSIRWWICRVVLFSPGPRISIMRARSSLSVLSLNPNPTQCF
jgi:probable HAF family extracellular repeat protein